MAHYIDADRLKAEIERRMTENCELAEKAGGAFGQRAVEDNDILALIDSLQQEQPQIADASKMEQLEVDLDAEINKLYDGEYHDTEDVARHFYELGTSVMRKRITNPEFNQKVIEKMKYECPVDEFNARKDVQK